jgi:hypothetical protein
MCKDLMPKAQGSRLKKNNLIQLPSAFSFELSALIYTSILKRLITTISGIRLQALGISVQVSVGRSSVAAVFGLDSVIEAYEALLYSLP